MKHPRSANTRSRLSRTKSQHTAADFAAAGHQGPLRLRETSRPFVPADHRQLAVPVALRTGGRVPPRSQPIQARHAHGPGHPTRRLDHRPSTQLSQKSIPQRRVETRRASTINHRVQTTVTDPAGAGVHGHSVGARPDDQRRQACLLVPTLPRTEGNIATPPTRAREGRRCEVT